MLFQKKQQKELGDLNGKVALVTGASRGIGKAIALLLADYGADVIINYRKSKGKAEEVVKEIKKKGKEAVAVKADISKVKETKKLVRESVKIFNKIDILVNNAGVAEWKDLIDMKEDVVADILDTNLKGLILLTKEVLQHMEKGAIISISSGAGKSGFFGLAAYCATKFGVIGFTQSLAGEVYHKGINVYAVCPGPVDTDMWHALSPRTPKMLIIKPETVAKRVLECVLGKYKTGEAVDV